MGVNFHAISEIVAENILDTRRAWKVNFVRPTVKAVFHQGAAFFTEASNNPADKALVEGGAPAQAQDPLANPNQLSTDTLLANLYLSQWYSPRELT